MNQLTNWRGARIASLVPNILPQEKAAACVEGAGECWCLSTYPGTGALSSCVGYIYCVDCYGRLVQNGKCELC